MARLLLLPCSFLLTFGLFAQAPQRMSFQAVLRDAGDALLVNAPVGVRVSVLQGSATGTAVYTETHATTTNANGLATLVIGDGTVVSGDIATIDWANGPYYLKTETDPSGGSAYSIAGTSQLLSVPYALHAANNMQGPAGPQGPQGEAGCDVVKAGNLICVYTSTNAYGLYQSESSSGLNGANWAVVSLSGTVLGVEASENTILVYTTTNAYGLYQSESSSGLNGANWTVVTLEGTPLGAESNKNQVAVYTSTNAYGLYQSESTSGLNGANWAVVTLEGTPVGTTASRHQILVFTNTNAYGLYQSQSSSGFNNANWTVVTMEGTVIGAEPVR